MIDFAALSQAPAQVNEPAGHVFVIRCEPDPFTGERINIGVCAVDKNGTRKVKVIESAGRLDCLYGEAGGASIVSMAQIAGACASEGLTSPSSQIVFDVPTPYFNSSLDDIVSSTFADQVTVALPRRSTPSKPHVDDEAALKLVSDRVKQMHSLATDFLANTPTVLIQTDRGPRAVTVPFQPRNGVGCIRSADYSAATLKTHLMDSLLDLECAARYRNKHRLGIFILRSEDEPRKEAEAKDQVIDSVSFRAPNSLRLEVEFSVEALASSVSSWALEAN